jgi:hypothetical protein
MFGRTAGGAAMAERLLDAAAALTSARCAALFVREVEKMTLFASHALDQRSLDVVTKAWVKRRAELEAGQIVLDADALFVPVFEAGQLLGLMYLSRDSGAELDAKQHEALARFAGVAAVAFSMPVHGENPHGAIDLFLERATADDIARRRLLVLLERHEWNIARVSRALGVTRPTVYRSLERLGLPRRKVRVTKSLRTA